MGAFEGELGVHYNVVRSRLVGQEPIGRYQEQIDELRREVELLKQRLAALVKPEEDKSPPIGPVERIIRLVCKHEAIDLEIFKSHRRIRHQAVIRMMAYYLAANHCKNRTIGQIARCFGNRDHSTIIYGRDKIASLRPEHPDLDEQLKWYERQIKAWPT